MAEQSASPRSKQRLRILDAYRGRGRKDNNLFLVYSVKTDRDWILPSDRQFVHWIVFLETAPNVKTFNLAPDIVFAQDEKELRGTELDAEVAMFDGHTEWHEVKSSESELEAHRSQLLAQAAAAWREGTKYRLFTDRDLTPCVRSSFPFTFRHRIDLHQGTYAETRDATSAAICISERISSHGTFNCMNRKRWMLIAEIC